MEDKDILIDIVKHINKCYRDYYYSMTIRGLPLELNSFASGLEKALIKILELKGTGGKHEKKGETCYTTTY